MPHNKGADQIIWNRVILNIKLCSNNTSLCEFKDLPQTEINIQRKYSVIK